MSGWTKHWRSMWSHPVAQDQDRHYVWLWMIDHAAWETCDRRIRMRSYVLAPGDVVASLGDVQRVTGCTRSKARAIMSWLQREGMISVRSEGRQAVVSILNWGRFQAEMNDTPSAPLATQQAHSQRTPSDTLSASLGAGPRAIATQQAHSQRTPSAPLATQQAHPTEEGKKEDGKNGRWEDGKTHLSADTPKPPSRKRDVRFKPSAKLPLSGTRIQYPEEFTPFWTAYPNGAGKRNAYDAWATFANRGEEWIALMLTGAKAYARETQGREKHLIKHAQGWINGARWEDAQERQPGGAIVTEATTFAEAGFRVLDFGGDDECSGS